MKKVLMICFMLAMLICIGGCNKNVGKLYTLEEAYDLNLITKYDLKNMFVYTRLCTRTLTGCQSSYGF